MMIRMYNNIAEQLLVALVYLRYRLGRNSSAAFNELSPFASDVVNGRLRDVELGPEVQQSLVRTLDRNPLDTTFTDIIDQLVKQLNEGAGPVKTHDKDLIETVVRLLQLDYVKNKLSSENIGRLRAAILLPSELATLRTHLNNEMTCSCGHKFQHGEMASILGNGPDGGAKVTCINCYRPEWIACANGKHSVEAPKGFYKVLAKRSQECDICKEDAKERVAAIEPIVLEDRPRDVAVVNPITGMPGIDIQFDTVPRANNPVYRANNPFYREVQRQESAPIMPPPTWVTRTMQPVMPYIVVDELAPFDFTDAADNIQVRTRELAIRVEREMAALNAEEEAIMQEEEAVPTPYPLANPRDDDDDDDDYRADRDREDE
jgi:hypothetical protein